ncbi:MAG: hypothetical protein HZC51_01940 [Nitrospirae bacterium]|nr:hypothetical protein [Nitrospirota bacterium]
MITTIQRLLSWRLFSRDEDKTDTMAIIMWWESRRIFYNVIVGVCGIITIIVLLSLAAIAETLFKEPIGWPDPPLFAVFGVVAYGVAANICYTGGWATEIVVRKVWGEKSGDFWQISFVLGLIFSILLTLSPGGLVAGVLSLKLFFRAIG